VELHAKLDTTAGAATTPALVLPRGRRRIAWTPLALAARVTGSVDVDRQRHCLEAVPGYADLVVSDVLPWRVPVTRLLWAGCAARGSPSRTCTSWTVTPVRRGRRSCSIGRGGAPASRG